MKIQLKSLSLVQDMNVAVTRGAKFNNALCYNTVGDPLLHLIRDYNV